MMVLRAHMEPCLLHASLRLRTLRPSAFIPWSVERCRCFCGSFPCIRSYRMPALQPVVPCCCEPRAAALARENARDLRDASWKPNTKSSRALPVGSTSGGGRAAGGGGGGVSDDEDEDGLGTLTTSGGGGGGGGARQERSPSRRMEGSSRRKMWI